MEAHGFDSRPQVMFSLNSMSYPVYHISEFNISLLSLTPNSEFTSNFHNVMTDKSTGERTTDFSLFLALTNCEHGKILSGEEKVSKADFFFYSLLDRASPEL